MGAEMLNIDQSAEELHHIHGVRDYYDYLRSPQFVEAFVKPVAAIVNAHGDAVLDVGCGDAMLASYVRLEIPYAGIDGAGPAIHRAVGKTRSHPKHVCYQQRIESPAIVGEFPTCVMSGILEVLIKLDQRVPFMQMYRDRYKVQRFVVCDLERLDESLISREFGQPLYIDHRIAAPVDGVDEVKHRRKILVWRAIS